MVIEPQTADEMASALRHASDERQRIVIQGAGSKRDWGRTADRIDATLCTRQLNRILAHEVCEHIDGRDLHDQRLRCGRQRRQLERGADDGREAAERSRDELR